jgi:hypothetical protein
MSSTEATTADGGATDTPETRESSSAAERLGGPIDGEESRERVREAETGDERQIDTAKAEDVQRPGTARRAETSDDREAAGEGVRRSYTADQAGTAADRQADRGERQRTTLIEPERAASYNGRWNELKSEFVDDPRRAVRGASQLVGEVLDDLEELFRRQRADLEHGLDSEQTTTEDLRLALGRYRSFFDRLLSF